MPHSVMFIVAFLLSSRLVLLQVAGTVPAFLWTPDYPLSSSGAIIQDVNYQTICLKDLTKSVMYQGGWYKSLCFEKQYKRELDVALIFVGEELLSSNIPETNVAQPAVLRLLKESFTRSNFSMAFPYVSMSNVKNELLSAVAGSCETGSKLANVVVTESCASKLNHYETVLNLDKVKEHILSNSERRKTVPADVVFFCHQSPDKNRARDQLEDESATLSHLINYVESLKLKYSVLYVSDPSYAVEHASTGPMKRSLGENTTANVSLNAVFCNEICQIKSSLLEGLLVGVVLLIILLSGLCCMMGIDTPIRFETPQES